MAVAQAIGNAIYDATGVRIKSLPITPERILKAFEGGCVTSPTSAGPKVFTLFPVGGSLLGRLGWE